MPASLTTYDAALKDNYGPGLRNALNNSNPIFTEVTRNDTDIIGRQAVWAAHVSRSTSTGSRAESATLPSPSAQSYEQLTSKMAYLYHTVKVTGQALAATKTDTGAFVRALDSEMKHGEQDMKNDLARQALGQKVTINSTLMSGAILPASSAYAANVFTFSGATASEFRPIFVGEEVDVIDASAGTVIISTTVVSKDAANKTVTVADGTGSTALGGDFLVRKGSLNAEINGLRHLINATQPFAGVDPSSVPAWAACSIDASSADIDEGTFDKALEAVETDGNGSTPNLYIVEHAQRRVLAASLQKNKRYDGRQVTLKAGWRGLDIAQGVLLAERYCPNTVGFAITPSEISRFVMEDFSWDDDDGRVLSKASDGSDAVEARFKVYHQLVATTRNAHCVVKLKAQT